MKKFQKLALIAALTATVSGAGMIAGCGSAAKEEVGVYHCNKSSFAAITQGKLIRSYSDSIVIYSDNTFSGCSVFDCYYSSDGETYVPTSYMAFGIYGTYEVISEDADLGEMTIKITAVSALESEAKGLVSSENFDTAVSEAVSSVLIGKEFILDGAYKMSTGFDDSSFTVGLSMRGE